MSFLPFFNTLDNGSKIIGKAFGEVKREMCAESFEDELQLAF